MTLIDRLELGGRRQLLLVECDGQRYLVGAGGDSVHSIAEIRAQPDDGATSEKAGWGL
jgi:flagellar biogenesis protein FliO